MSPKTFFARAVLVAPVLLVAAGPLAADPLADLRAVLRKAEGGLNRETANRPASWSWNRATV